MACFQNEPLKKVPKIIMNIKILQYLSMIY